MHETDEKGPFGTAIPNEHSGRGTPKTHPKYTAPAPKKQERSGTIMDELNELVEQYITDKLSETIAAVTENPDHKEDVNELNRLFDAEIAAHHAARRYTYFHIGRTIENFYEKGFYAGVEFAKMLLLKEEPHK